MSRPRPRLCAAGVQLLKEVNALWPDRDTASDGWIADAAHIAAGVSDHIPDASGIVRAVDIDADLDNGDLNDMAELMEQMRRLGRTGRDRKRIAYLIFDRQIASPRQNWTWRRYKGVNAHRKHAHISFTKAGDRDATRWGITND